MSTQKAPEDWKESVMAPLREWLVQHHARCNWSVPIENVGTVGGCVVNGHLFVLVDYTNGGWDAFTMPPSPEIDKTLTSLEDACGLHEREETQ